MLPNEQFLKYVKEFNALEAECKKRMKEKTFTGAAATRVLTKMERLILVIRRHAAEYPEEGVR